jgi:hypothetical protein
MANNLALFDLAQLTVNEFHGLVKTRVLPILSQGKRWELQEGKEE